MTFPRDKANETLLCIGYIIKSLIRLGYLGVIIDVEMKWTDDRHINHVYKKNL